MGKSARGRGVLGPMTIARMGYLSIGIGVGIGIMAAFAGCHARTPTPPAPAPRLGARVPVERAEWRSLIERDGLRGTIAVYDAGRDELACARVELCTARRIPASTFKIANALIGLETGAVDGPAAPFPWDGVRRSIEDWNRDHTLASAMAASCLPCFQALARRIGRPAMDAWLAKLDYGDRRTDGVIDRFWIDGSLHISPLEQVDFLRRLDVHALPVSERARAVVRDILVNERRGERVLRAKTGWAAPHTPDEVGWFVGWVEGGGRPPIYFATLLLPPEGAATEVDLRPRRKEAALRVLEAIGAF